MSHPIELGDQLVSVGYPNAGQPVTFYAHQPRAVLATFGPAELVTSHTGAFTMDPMVSSLQMVTAGNVPDAGNNEFVEAVNFAVRDMAGHRVATVCPSPGVDGAFTQGGPGPPAASAVASAPNGSCIQRQNNNIRPNVLAGLAPGATPFNFGGLGIQAFVQNPICRHTAVVGFTAACPAPTGTVVTLRAEAHGAQGLFANPFESLRFYMKHADRWVLVEGTADIFVVDDDVQAIRRWIYRLQTTTTQIPAGTEIRAVGIRGNSGLAASNTDRFVP
jgi:hypothetical protein